jgi:type IV pilus assembly protein PilN
LKKERLIARMRAIETLQGSRPLIVRLFDELVRVLPDGVYIKEITQQDKRVTIRGSAQSNARVSTMMRNVESSQWLTRPTLNVIQAQNEDGQRIAEFTLVVEQAGVAAPDEAAQAKPRAKAKAPAPAARSGTAAKGNAAAKGGA